MEAASQLYSVIFVRKVAKHSSLLEEETIKATVLVYIRTGVFRAGFYFSLACFLFVKKILYGACARHLKKCSFSFQHDYTSKKCNVV